MLAEKDRQLTEIVVRTEPLRVHLDREHQPHVASREHEPPMAGIATADAVVAGSAFTSHAETGKRRLLDIAESDHWNVDCADAAVVECTVARSKMRSGARVEHPMLRERPRLQPVSHRLPAAGVNTGLNAPQAPLVRGWSKPTLPLPDCVR